MDALDIFQNQIQTLVFHAVNGDGTAVHRIPLGLITFRDPACLRVHIFRIRPDIIAALDELAALQLVGQIDVVHIGILIVGILLVDTVGIAVDVMDPFAVHQHISTGAFCPVLQGIGMEPQQIIDVLLFGKLPAAELDIFDLFRIRQAGLDPQNIHMGQPQAHGADRRQGCQTAEVVHVKDSRGMLCQHLTDEPACHQTNGEDQEVPLVHAQEIVQEKLGGSRHKHGTGHLEHRPQDGESHGTACALQIPNLIQRKAQQGKDHAHACQHPQPPPVFGNGVSGDGTLQVIAKQLPQLVKIRGDLGVGLVHHMLQGRQVFHQLHRGDDTVKHGGIDCVNEPVGNGRTGI